MPGSRILLRADGSARMGTGHLMRCLAMAQAIRDGGGDAVLVTHPGNPAIEARFRSEGVAVIEAPEPCGTDEDAKQTSAIAHRRGATWIVTDGYHFGAGYQKIVKDQGLFLLVVDDNGDSDHYHADLVLNQNIHAHKALYQSRESHTHLLLGARYALLRREFLHWSHWAREVPPSGKRVLVTIGGGDADNVTAKVLRSLQPLLVTGVQAKVVVGGSNSHYDNLKAKAEGLGSQVGLLRAVEQMAPLMAWADVAVGSAGTTSWEMAYMGLPAVLIIIAENQRAVAEHLHRAGVAIDLGWHEEISTSKITQTLTELLRSEKRSEMAARGRQVVDGKGVGRVLASIKDRTVAFRRLVPDDRRWIWEWANEPDVRAVSFNSDPIPWEEHVAWFDSKLGDPDCMFLVAVDGDGTPIGHVRLDAQDDEAVLSVTVGPAFRRRGLGKMIMRSASARALLTSEIEKIHAYVKPGNERSLAAFAAAGFRDNGTATVRGHDARHFVFTRRELERPPSRPRGVRNSHE